MARQAREQSPTDYYHIIMRGNNREKIFSSNAEKEFLLDCLKLQEEAGMLKIAAYCIMDNHVHIVGKAELSNMTKAIKSINTSYAMRYNAKRDRIGHVFQDRFKSEAITDDKYLLQVIRYVHKNPVKAKIVKHLKDYEWSSYNEYINDAKVISKEQKDFILGYFINSIKQFEEFHEKTDNNKYLEIKEDEEQERFDRGQEIISEYFEEKGLTEGKQVIKNSIYLDDLVKRILKESRLSHRQIANLLGISNNVVHKISKSKE